ncbi:MAG: hypothetical protein Q8O26_02420 [Phreatobacter sp.]|uniref:hypothetical protein n=1 Tax=Phreatobacter sp. TaxID=1966341 RepID=UPI002732B922|nr:hypothetical protein [Phreatobacter sp.]MDP2800715.1 hypothetical protein [Phreatobacter sp.]
MMMEYCKKRHRSPLKPLLATLAGIALLMPLHGPVRADGPALEPRDFRGVWVGDTGHCRWANDFNIVYGRRSAEFPRREGTEPSHFCRIMSVEGRRPLWKLRLACRHFDPEHRAPRMFEVRQTIRMMDDGYRMMIEREPVLGQPARTEEVFYCRRPSDPEPVLMCFSREKGHTVPCEP